MLGIFSHNTLIIFIIIIIIINVSCHRPFLPVLPLNQRWSPPLRLQASHCSTFRIMCDVPSIAVFCNESIKCFPDTASKFLLKLLVTIPVAPIIVGIIVHFRFHIRCISIHILLYFNFFSASFCTTFLSAGITTSISVHVSSFLFLIIISGLFVVTSLSLCTSWFHNTVTSPSSYYYIILYYYIYIIIIIISSSSSSSSIMLFLLLLLVVVVVVLCLVTDLFFLAILLLNHCWSPALRLRISDSRTLLFISDISKYMRLFLVNLLNDFLVCFQIFL